MQLGKKIWKKISYYKLYHCTSTCRKVNHKHEVLAFFKSDWTKNLQENDGHNKSNDETSKCRQRMWIIIKKHDEHKESNDHMKKP